MRATFAIPPCRFVVALATLAVVASGMLPPGVARADAGARPNGAAAPGRPSLAPPPGWAVATTVARPLAGARTAGAPPSTAGPAPSGGTTGGPPPLPSPTALCRAAIATAEREFGLPPGLLGAIGRVESGRRDPETGEAGPYPWTINAEGAGRFFRAKAEAVAHVGQLRAGGMRSIDVGCMQVNLRHHPDAFPDLETAFDPMANARYAARFLSELGAEAGGDWHRAMGHYHSRTPERAELYRAAVARHLPEARREAASAAAGGGGAAAGWNPAWSSLAAASAGSGGAAGTVRGRPPLPASWLAARARPAAPLEPVASLPFASRAAGGVVLGGVGGGGGGGAVSASASSAGVGGTDERGRGLAAYRAVPVPLATRLPPFVRPPPAQGPAGGAPRG